MQDKWHALIMIWLSWQKFPAPHALTSKSSSSLVDVLHSVHLQHLTTWTHPWKIPASTSSLVCVRGF